ncbi:gamma-glutamyl peptidase 2-like isoform X2 [Oryza brachyantha]|uniref:gamma-glutamyl peptidase 2-like isoform X2 n=1 Tax=Oryza brachyantha TaxID=4533 RepID=UPI001ADC9610|nr:gamma-glutamyl peptidase 2-like isoform X2 [Oryza brachyantha]
MTVAAAGGGGGRRYALLLALKDSEYARKVYGGYGNVFMAALGGGGERWDCFRVVDGEFPAAEELGLYDGFVVSGSPHDAYGDDRWILRLCSLLRTLHAMNKRLLGICFGHQVLCRALGGRVGKARGGWDIGVKKVTFVPGLQLFGDLEELPQSASIIEVHQDERSIGEEAQRTTEGGEPDREFWTSLCKGFLRGPSTPAIATPTVEIDVPSPEMTMSYSHVAGGHFAAAATVAL